MRSAQRFAGCMAVAGLLLIAATARAELRIEITEGLAEATPIAIVPFGWQGNGAKPYPVAEVVAADLARTGRFKPVPESSMLQKPTSRTEIDFSDWRMINTQVVVVGQILPAGADYTVEFRVFSVYKGELLLGYRMPATAAQLRSVAHRISDLIYEELTGVKGIAATSIAYVSVVGDPKNPRYRLVVADADGQNARVVLQSSAPIMSPAWSPDGRRLAYVSFENGASQVFVLELRSGTRRRVSARKGVNSAPVWSPDGR